MSGQKGGGACWWYVGLVDVSGRGFVGPGVSLRFSVLDR